MSLTIEEAKAEVAKLKSDLVQILDRFHQNTGLKLRTGINIQYIETQKIGGEYERRIESVSFDVQL